MRSPADSHQGFFNSTKWTNSAACAWSFPLTFSSELHVPAPGGWRSDARKKYIFRCCSTTCVESQIFPHLPQCSHTLRQASRLAHQIRSQVTQPDAHLLPVANTNHLRRANPSLPATSLATPSPASSTASAVRCNKKFPLKAPKNHPQRTHPTALTSRLTPLERTPNRPKLQKECPLRKRPKIARNPLIPIHL